MRKIIPLAAVLLVAMLVILAGPYWLNLVVDLGHNIPQANLADDYMIGVVWCALLGFSIVFWPVPARDKKILLWLWGAKAAVMLVIMLYVESHYDVMDAFSYFIASGDQSVPWFPLESSFLGNYSVIDIARLQRILLRVDSYQATKVTFGMIGLAGLYITYRAAFLFVGEERPRLLWILGLWPSILYWSSILGKEPVALLGVSLYIYGTIGLYKLRRRSYLAFVILGLIVVMFIRVWMGPILLVPLMFFVLFAVRGIIPKVGILIVAAGVLWFGVRGIQSRFRVENREEATETLNAMSNYNEGGGSSLTTTIRSDSPAFLPLGMFTALFRPLPGEVANIFGWFAGLDDLGLLLLFVAAVYRTRMKELGNPLILWAAGVIITWSMAYASISYSNLGTTARTKLQILPAFLAFLLYMSQPRRASAEATLPDRRQPISQVAYSLRRS